MHSSSPYWHAYALPYNRAYMHVLVKHYYIQGANTTSRPFVHLNCTYLFQKSILVQSAQLTALGCHHGNSSDSNEICHACKSKIHTEL